MLLCCMKVAGTLQGNFQDIFWTLLEHWSKNIGMLLQLCWNVCRIISRKLHEHCSNFLEHCRKIAGTVQDHFQNFAGMLQGHGNVTEVYKHLNKPADLWNNKLWTLRPEPEPCFEEPELCLEENHRPTVKHGSGGVVMSTPEFISLSFSLFWFWVCSPFSFFNLSETDFYYRSVFSEDSRNVSRDSRLEDPVQPVLVRYAWYVVCLGAAQVSVYVGVVVQKDGFLSASTVFVLDSSGTIESRTLWHVAWCHSAWTGCLDTWLQVSSWQTPKTNLVPLDPGCSWTDKEPIREECEDRLEKRTEKDIDVLKSWSSWSFRNKFIFCEDEENTV